MERRLWILILGVSFMLHLVVFWPSPAPKLQRSDLSTFSVRILPVVSDPDISNLGKQEAKLPVFTSGPSSKSIPSEGKNGSPRNAEADKGLPELGRSGVPKAAPTASRSDANSIENGAVPSPGRADSPAISETGSLARYRIALAAAAIRLSAGGTSAGDGLTGTAVVDVHFSGPTGVPQVKLALSSGFEPLDNEAVTLLTRAVHMVPVSDAGPIGNVSLQLPVVFESAGK